MSGIDSVIKVNWENSGFLASAEKDGIPAEVNFAEYGNDSIPAGQNTRKILSFVPDFDAVAEKLFLLKFRGKNKYCGAAIWASINGLDWDRGQDVYKAIFIIGNGSFFDGPVDYRNAVAASSRKGIQVNCIYYGSKEKGIEAGWAGCSDLGAGKYSNYEYAAKFVEEQTQFDKKILKLGSEFNRMYLPLSSGDKIRYKVISKLDSSTKKMASSGAYIERIVFKATGQYLSSSWDSLDGIKTGNIKVSELSSSVLPKEIRNMSLQRWRNILTKASARKRLVDKIRALNSKAPVSRGTAGKGKR